jgi:uncharacterized protein YkwD
MIRHSTLPLFLALLAPSLTACANEDDGYCAMQEHWPKGWIEYEAEVYDLVNQRRSEGARCDGAYHPPVPTLRADPELRCAGRVHAADMARRGYFSHDNPEGENFVDRVFQTDYMGTPTGENIAYGLAPPEVVMAAWMDSPGHCRNIMSPHHTAIGVGYFGQHDYWAKVMGRD